MKERPILFSGAMVRAILAGRKTQTRRIMKIQPDPRVDWVMSDLNDVWRAGTVVGEVPQFGTFKCPWGAPGDRLWVKETFLNNALAGYEPVYFFRADDEDKPDDLSWRPSIFMPRVASRITLEIVKIKCEKLNTISVKDAVAEGVDWWPSYAIPLYKELWESINGPESLKKNPWVWVIEFRVL